MIANEPIFEGWKQIADVLKYSERQTYRFFKVVSERLTLRHYLGPGRRIRMSSAEIETFKALIVEDTKLYARPPVPHFMSDPDTICQGKLFD